MTLSKTQLRAAGMHDVGARLDDELEKAYKMASAATGAVAALGEAVKDVGGMVNQIQAQIEKGELDLESGKHQINGIEIAKNTLLNLVANARKNANRLEGVAQGLKAAVESASKLHTIELKKAGLADDEMIPAPDPLRQQAQVLKKTIKQQRLEEEASAKKKVAKKKPTKKKAKKKAAKKKTAKKA